jgi:hypothetical protein
MNKKSFITYLIIASIILLSSCTTFYKVRSVDNSKQDLVKPLYRYDSEKYQFVLHSSDLMWALENVKLFQGKITGTYSELGTKELTYYEKLKDDKLNARVPFSDLKYIYQVHIYANKFLHQNNLFQVSENDIEGIDVYNLNEGLTAVAMVGTVSLTAFGALAAILAISCSCPHVYSFDGNTYQFNNGLFTGAVSPKLERFDYKVLPDLMPDEDSYKIMITSDENENQYLNMLSLMTIVHEKNTQVIPDQDGKLYTIKEPILPSVIINDKNQDIKNNIKFPDDIAYNFNTISDDGFSNVYASFNIDKQEDTKLILSLNNTKWGGFVYNEFSKKFGWYHDDWVRKNQRKTRDEMLASMKAQGITLTVSIKTGNSWKDIDVINLIGDAAFNKIVVPIAKDYIEGSTVEIRLQSGFMFWQLDYLAMDNTPEHELQIEYPKMSIINNEKNVNQALFESDDNSYLEHISLSDTTYIEFKGLLTDRNFERTIILKSKGYYLRDDKMEGSFKLSELRKFKEPASLSRYSEQLYEQYFPGLAVKN